MKPKFPFQLSGSMATSPHCRVRPLRTIRLTLGLVAALSPLAFALPTTITWIGGNVDWVDNGSTANWSPADEPDSDDAVIFNTANTVNLGSSNSVVMLSLSNGISLATNNFNLAIGDTLQLTGTGTDITIEESTSLVRADFVTINSAAQITLAGGVLNVSHEAPAVLFNLNAGGTLYGHGTINFQDSLTATTTLMRNYGTISASSGTGILIPPVGTLQVNANDPTDARLDLDATDKAVVNVLRNQTLDINVTLAGAYSGDLNLFHNSTLDMSSAWSIDAGATVDVNNGALLKPSTPAGTSYIAGAAFTQTGGTITVVDTDGTLQFNAPFTQSGGNLVNNGKVIFNANATIGAGANFTMPVSTSSLTVNPGVTVNIDQANFNADGGGSTTNVITVGNAANLDLDVGTGGDISFDGPIVLNGGELDVTSTAVDAWSKSGPLTVGASTGISYLNGEPVTLYGTTTIGTGSTLRVNAASTLPAGASIEVASGAWLQLNANTLNGVTSITGAGTLQVLAATTVAANSTIDVGTFDWDGTAAGSNHTINSGVTLTINSPHIDTDGTIYDNITLGGTGSTLTVNGPTEWTMYGTLNSNPAAATTAAVGGTSRVIFGGALNANSGTTSISAPVTFGTGSTTVAAGALLTVSGNTIHNGGTITGAGYYNPPGNNTVAANSTISTTDFNFDSGNWTVQPGAQLTVNVSDYDPDTTTNGFDNILTLNSGSINVSTGDPKFVMGYVLNMNTTSGTFANWIGEPIQLGDDVAPLTADLNVAGAGIAQIVDIDFMSDADVFIDSGATLQVLGTARFNSVNGANSAEFTGTGKLETTGAVYFDEATTLNMSTIDLDGSDAIGSIIQVNAPVVINAATLESFGKTNQSGYNILDINHSSATGALTINLDDPSAEWTVNSPGSVILNNNPAAAAATLLAGSAVNLNGHFQITGDVRTTARADIAGSINIQTAGKPFRLAGGDLSNPNILAGGTISGPGILGADNGRCLTGYGTIHANIDFDGISDLLADNGILTINGAILDANQVGTADSDGILNVVNAWYSSGVTTILMQGGTLQGGRLTITNSSGIRGHGLVTAKVINDTLINGNNSSAPLILQTAANDNDWDGAENTGMLQATGGTLELRDTAGFSFNSTVSVSGGTVYANGFALAMSSSSTLNLTAGTFKQSNGITTDLFGAITVGAGTSSLLGAATGGFRFNATSVTTLTGNLQLDCPTATIRAGATYAGAGALKIPAGSFVGADSGANVNVLTDNAGDFIVSGSGLTGRVDVKDYQQSPSGDLQLDLRGTALANYDRLLVGGTAQIAGDLEITLGGGYIPVLGDTFSILSATAGVIGTFKPPVQSTVMPDGLIFKIVYSPTLVQLKVVAGSTFETWIDSFTSLTNPADKTKDANPDNDDLNNLGEFATDGNPANGASTGKIVGKIAPVGGSDALTLTLPLRNGTVSDPADPVGGELGLIQAADGLKYRIRASDTLGSWPLTVTEVTGADAAAIQLGLPGLNSGWTYRTFHSPGPVAGDPGEFMRVEISE